MERRCRVNRFIQCVGVQASAMRPIVRMCGMFEWDLIRIVRTALGQVNSEALIDGSDGLKGFLSVSQSPVGRLKGTVYVLTGVVVRCERQVDLSGGRTCC